MVRSLAPAHRANGIRTPPLLAVVGSDTATKEKGTGGFRLGGSSDVYKLLPEGLPFDQLNISRQFADRHRRPEPARYPIVLNLVTDADQHPKTLARLAKLLRGHRGRVINRPEIVLGTTRDQVAGRLAGIAGLHVPKAIRLRGGDTDDAARELSQAGLEYPVILRQAGTHTGKILGLFDGPEDLISALPPDGDCFATEFVDLRGTDGLFRKYRVYFFGRSLVYRNLYVSDQWNVHSRDHVRCLAERPELADELEAMFTRPEGNFPDFMAQVFAAVRERMRLDFFGMDFGFAPDGGRAVLFEANATMSFFPSWADIQFRHCLEPARRAFREMLVS